MVYKNGNKFSFFLCIHKKKKNASVYFINLIKAYEDINLHFLQENGETSTDFNIRFNLHALISALSKRKFIENHLIILENILTL